MANRYGIVVIGAAAFITIGVILLTAKPAGAATRYSCPYGDGLSFSTIEELQAHVITAHPGQPIPIDIRLE